jgi:NAD(P) transhydrogenase subunit alpha
MIYLGTIKETKHKENRVALSPEVTADLVKKGFGIRIEAGAGILAGYSDAQYQTSGAELCSAEAVLSQSDILLQVNAPAEALILKMKAQSVLISFMYASTHPELIAACKSAGISAFSMDAIPRISRAQKMDALSSQANLAGYKAVLLATEHLGKIFPMMTTAAGTIKPSKVVIFGAGVAGLQAIATAKRLGAIVEVSDIRPETKEQVESLGAKFIEVKQDASVKTEGGYVKELSADFLKRQQELVTKHVQEADVVITTALIPGKKAPLLVTEAMLDGMRAGSVIVDMAVEQGGNVFGSRLNETYQFKGITMVGESNLPALLPLNASALYAKNIATLLLHLAGPEGLRWEREEEITKGSLMVYNGQPVHPTLLNSN